MSKKRKAWDEAIQAVASSVSAPKKLGAPARSRETRRRVNSRRWIASSGEEDIRRKMEARLELMEEAPDTIGDEVEEEEWNDEEQQDKDPDAKKGRKAKNKAAKKIKSTSTTASAAVSAKGFRVRPLAQVLLDEGATVGPSYASAEGGASRFPSRKICAVTGLVGTYRDPNSGLAFASRSAQAQLKETPPPWLHLSGNAPYFDAMRILREAMAASGGGGPRCSGT